MIKYLFIYTAPCYPSIHLPFHSLIISLSIFMHSFIYLSFSLLSSSPSSRLLLLFCLFSCYIHSSIHPLSLAVPSSGDRWSGWAGLPPLGAVSRRQPPQPPADSRPPSYPVPAQVSHACFLSYRCTFRWVAGIHRWTEASWRCTEVGWGELQLYVHLKWVMVGIHRQAEVN